MLLPVPGKGVGIHPPSVSASVESHEPQAMDVPSRNKETAIRELLESCARSFVARDKHVRANMMTFSPDRTRRRVHAETAYNMDADPDRDLEIGATAAASGKAVTRATRGGGRPRVAADYGRPGLGPSVV